LILGMLILATSCESTKKDNKLPIYGRKKVEPKEVNGKVEMDTIYHEIADFQFLDQDSSWVTNATFENKIYIADFFFTSCPTICPITKAQMLRVYDQFKDNDKVTFLSHSIDPDHDTVPVLHNFADRLGVRTDKWHFVTGDIEDIYDIAQSSYMTTAMEALPLREALYMVERLFWLITIDISEVFMMAQMRNR
ncbi:SCO family protein, partial [Xanthovirga aplysinae]|uniref:SCO family protein n=1 Tax=Xanthovirga aplysinae TaxID=2529853 RepID=UPI0031B5FB4D